MALPARAAAMTMTVEEFLAYSLPDAKAELVRGELLDDYLFSGTPLIWVVDPVRRTVMIIADDAPVSWLRDEGTLVGARVVPGFTCAVSDIFEGIARETPA